MQTTETTAHGQIVTMQWEVNAIPALGIPDAIGWSVSLHGDGFTEYAQSWAKDTADAMVASEKAKGVFLRRAARLSRKAIVR